MSKVYIIAEAGVNHNGNMNIAKKMIDVAAEAGVDAIKFQSFKAENLVCRNARKAEYQLQNTESNESQYEMLKKLELTEEMHKELIAYCYEKGIKFLSTPFDLDSIDLLSSYHLDVYKLPSGEITNYPYLKKIGSLKKEVILSTGMSTLQEIKEAVKLLMDSGATKISLLHCNTQYPTPVQDVNLSAMNTIRDMLGLPVGYSDHTQGIEVSIAAVAMGATIIEKHFTLDRTMEGPDHKASLEPQELMDMVKAIRNIDKAIGNGIKEPSQSEKENMKVARKSIVAARCIKIGEEFTEDNITAKRPGTGMSPMNWQSVIGKKSSKNYEIDEQIMNV